MPWSLVCALALFGLSCSTGAPKSGSQANHSGGTSGGDAALGTGGAGGGGGTSTGNVAGGGGATSTERGGSAGASVSGEGVGGGGGGGNAPGTGGNSGTGGATTPPKPCVSKPSDYDHPFRNPCLPLEERLTDLFGLLTDQEKLSLMNENQPAIARLGIGFFTVATEGLHGLGWANNEKAVLSTQYPQASGLAETWDPELLTRAFAQVGLEARVYHKRFNGTHASVVMRSPVVDLARDPRGGRIEESLGEDPYHVGEIAKALVRGLQGSDPTYLQVASTVKHFLAYNDEEHRGTGNVVLDERNLREYYLVPFYEALMGAHAQSFMTSYNSVNGVPCVAQPMVKDIVRGEWGFDGMVSSDAGAMQRSANMQKYFPSIEDAAAGTVKIGTSVYIGGDAGALQRALASGKMTRADVDSALKGNFRMRFRLGEFDPPDRVPYASVDGASEPWNSASAKALARLVTQKSIVLFKNEGSLLPLDKTKVRNLAVVGPNAEAVVSDWYGGKPPYAITALAGIQAAAGTTIKVSSAPSGDAAVTLAAAADVAIVVIGNDPVCGTRAWGVCPSPTDSKEPLDRKSIDIKPEQLDLVQKVYAANKRTLVVLISSFSQSIPWIQENVPAIVHLAHSSQELGNGLADVLFGDYNPGGRTSVTWYKALTDIPEKTDYDIRKGRTYMYFQGTPLYPFGFGLSYTTFTFSKLSLSAATVGQGEQITVNVEVTNTGSRAGDEVVQLYVSYPTTAGVPRPIKQLRGFRRITLAPGEKQTVSLPLTYNQLAYWDATGKAFKVQPGTVKVTVAKSSADPGVQADLTAR